MADAADLLGLEDAYRAVNDTRSADAIAAAAEGGHDDKLARWITAVSRRIDTLCGPVVQRAVTGEIHDGGRPYVVLDVDHAATITAATEWASTTQTVLTVEDTPGTYPADAVMLDPIGGGVALARRRNAGADAVWADGRRNVVISYTAGRYADTASVDPLFATAAGAILRRLWARDGGAWNRGGSDPFAEGGVPAGFFKVVDPMVAEWLADEIRTPVVA